MTDEPPNPPIKPPDPPKGPLPQPQPGLPQATALPQATLAQLIMGALVRPAVPYMGNPALGPPGNQLVLPGIIHQAQHWQGPYPPPEAVERYGKVLPGSFNRMITMVEQLQAAQIEETRKALDYTQADSRRGQWLGWSVAILAMGGALGCLHYDNPWVAAIFLSVPVMAVAKALIDSAKSQTPTDLIRAAAEAAPTPIGPAPAVPEKPN